MKKKLKILVPVSILVFLIWVIIQQWSSVGDKIVSANPILLFISFLFIVLTYIGGAYFWYRILLAISFQTSFKEAFRVFIISNFGRFIPGVVMHYIARVYLIRGLGLGIKEGISTVFLEAYYTLASAVIIGLLALPQLVKFINLYGVIFLSLVIFVLIVFIPPLRLFAQLKKIPYLGKKVPIVTYGQVWKNHLFLLGLSTLLFILYGIAFFLLSSAFISNPLFRIVGISGLLAISWILGFVTPVAPGGLGVSDLSFAFLLSPFYNFSLASFLALVFRFSMFLAEGVMFLVVIKIFGFDVVSKSRKNE